MDFYLKKTTTTKTLALCLKTGRDQLNPTWQLITPNRNP